MDPWINHSAQNQAINYANQAGAVPQDRSRLSRVSEMTAALNGDLTTLKNILAEAHIAMTGHTGAPLTGASTSALPPAGPAPIPGLLNDIEGWMEAAAMHLAELRRLADQIHELVRR